MNEFYDKLVQTPELKERYSEMLEDQGYSVDDDEELMMANEELLQDINSGTISKRDDFSDELKDFISIVNYDRLVSAHRHMSPRYMLPL